MPIVTNLRDAKVVRLGVITFALAVFCWWIGGMFGVICGFAGIGYGWIAWELHLQQHGVPVAVSNSIFLELLLYCRLAFLAPLACFLFW